MRRQYLFYAVPDKMTTEIIGRLQDRISSDDVLTECSSLGPHCSLVGFYSDTEHKNALRQAYRLFKNRAVQTYIGDAAIFGEKLVLLFEEERKLREIHTQALEAFFEYMILKDGSYAKKNLPFFEKQFPFIRDRYRPHISLGEAHMLEHRVAEELAQIKGMTVCFNHFLFGERKWVSLS